MTTRSLIAGGLLAGGIIAGAWLRPAADAPQTRALIAELAPVMSRWFREERARDGADAAGNTTMLIDALADTGRREAVDALVAALDEHALPLANETLIVQRLGELRQGVAKPGIMRFQARVATQSVQPAADDLDEQLRTEALAAARGALAQLGG